MSIHFISGKPGGGKSLRAVSLIIEQLTTTDRAIITNLVLRLDVLQDYLDSKGHNVHVWDRIRILDDDDTKEFFLHRLGYDLPKCSGYDVKNSDENVDYSPLFEDKWFSGGKAGPDAVLKGTCYVIDEVQNHFNSRAWQSTGRHALFYLSQHRKLNDIVFCITQSIANVDKQLRSVSQDYTYCRNHRIEKFGIFKGDDKFTWKSYLSPAENGSVAINQGTYKLDLALAACYDTSAGVGLPGGGKADAGQRAKGLSFKIIFVAGALIVIACMAFLRYGLPLFTNRLLASGLGDTKAQAALVKKKDGGSQASRELNAVSAPAAAMLGVGVGQPVQSQAAVVVEPADVPPARTQEVVWVAFYQRGAALSWRLSDGRVIDASQVVQWTRTHLTFRDRGGKQWTVGPKAVVRAAAREELQLETKPTKSKP